MKKFLVFFMGIFLLVHSTAYASDDYELEKQIPEDVIVAAETVGEAYNICPELLESIAYHESRYKSDVYNGKGCYGLMQVNMSSHRKRLSKLNIKDTDIYDTYTNMLVAADYLSELFAQYEDTEIVLAIYHGEKNYSVTNPSSYVKDIMERSERLEKYHESQLYRRILTGDEDLLCRS